jgi:hypothetical protein
MYIVTLRNPKLSIVKSVRDFYICGNVSLYHPVQNGSRAHPASYPMGTRGSFPWSKAAGA